ncbi:MAG: radical SAM protein, partial [Clostridium sp.]
RKDPILGTIILTDKCNLSCKHCAVNNINGIIHPYTQIRSEMNLLYKKGIRILFFCGGETFLWRDGERDIRYLVKEAKEMGFLIVNVVTNGTYLIDLPEADLILLSLDGDRYNHNKIRGNTFDKIISNVRQATSNNICIYMAINKINKDDIVKVSNIAKNEPNIRAISFNFHTPYKGTEELSLSYDNKKHCLEVIEDLINKGYPIFNLKSAFKYILNNSFKRPCYQCVVIENGKISTCGRCIDEEGLCSQCGYFFVVEYSLIFNGNIKVIVDMFSTYLRYV